MTMTLISNMYVTREQVGLLSSNPDPATIDAFLADAPVQRMPDSTDRYLLDSPQVYQALGEKAPQTLYGVVDGVHDPLYKQRWISSKELHDLTKVPRNDIAEIGSTLKQVAMTLEGHPVFERADVTQAWLDANLDATKLSQSTAAQGARALGAGTSVGAHAPRQGAVVGASMIPADGVPKPVGALSVVHTPLAPVLVASKPPAMLTKGVALGVHNPKLLLAYAAPLVGWGVGEISARVIGRDTAGSVTNDIVGTAVGVGVGLGAVKFLGGGAAGAAASAGNLAHGKLATAVVLTSGAVMAAFSLMTGAQPKKS
jgi:hypothetical protein